VIAKQGSHVIFITSFVSHESGNSILACVNVVGTYTPNLYILYTFVQMYVNFNNQVSCVGFGFQV
jgi:hypothetical protein